jgi:hypothetical protein
MLNAQKNLFVIMGKMTDLQQIAMEFPGTTTTEIYDESKQIGKDIGEIIRVLTGYKKQ